MSNPRTERRAALAERTTEPRVSVIMPFLDTERYIEEAIESVLAQSFADWELLLIDDGSTDGSGAIARGYSENHPEQVRYLAHGDGKSHGASAARNVGLRAAHGEYLALLDADDVWLPNKLAEQVAMLDARPDVGALYGNTLYWHSWTREPLATDFLPYLGIAPGTVLQPPELLIRCLQESAAIPCTCSILLRREVVERVGGFEEEFRRVFTDQVFYAKLFLSTPVLVTDTWWDKYRIHADSSCSVTEREGRMHAARGAYLDWLATYLEVRKMSKGAVGRVVRRERLLQRFPRVAGLVCQARRSRPEVRRRLRKAWHRWSAYLR